MIEVVILLTITVLCAYLTALGRRPALASNWPRPHAILWLCQKLTFAQRGSYQSDPTILGDGSAQTFWAEVPAAISVG